MNDLVAAAEKAGAWAGEPLLHGDEDPAQVLAPETARRNALDEALTEIEAGNKTAVLPVEGALRAHARARARAVREASAPRVRHRAAPPPGGCARRDAHRADRGQPARGRGAANGNGSANGHVEPADLEEEDADFGVVDEEPLAEELSPAEDPGAIRRYRFRHPTASGKTIAAAGFVEAARTMGVLILTHRRLLVSQFNRELAAEGYGDRLIPIVEQGQTSPQPAPITVQTYAWFARHHASVSRDTYQLVIADEAHTALGEKTSLAIRSFPDPIYIGMTATEQLIAKQVSDVFPASVDDLPLQDAARRGLIAPLRNLRVPPAAAIHSVPIVGGDFEERALAAASTTRR